MKGQWAVIIGLIFVILIATFSVINVEPVEVNYLFGKNEWPLVLVILFSVLMGGVIVGSAGLYKFYQLKQENKELKKQLPKIPVNKQIEKKEATEKSGEKGNDTGKK